jgi:HAMP domain-containing protein
LRNAALRKENILVPAIFALSIMLFVAVLVVLFMLSRVARRVDRLAEQTRELAEHAEEQLEPKPPAGKQG